MPANDTHVTVSKDPKKKKDERWLSKLVMTGAGGALLLIIAVSMLFWGQGKGTMQEEGMPSFGSYDGQAIEMTSGSYFADRVEYYNYVMSMQNQEGQNSQMIAYQIYSYAFRDTVLHMAAGKTADAEGMSLSDAKLSSILVERPEFQENGKFSPKKYSDYRENRQKDLNAIVARIKEDEVARRYFSDYYGLKSSSKEAEFLKSMVATERSVEYVAFRFSDYPNEEVIAFAKSKPETFRKMQLARITLATEAEAKTVGKEIEGAKKTFAEAAKTYSKDSFASAEGLVGYKWFTDLAADLEKEADATAIFAMAKDAVSAPVKAKDGQWIIFKCADPSAAADFSDPASVTTARAWMNANEKGTIEKFMMAKASGFVAAARTDFDAACKKANLQKRVSEPFPLNYGDFSLFKQVNSKAVMELNGTQSSKAFLKTVFQAKPGDVPDPIALDGLVLAFKVGPDAAADAVTLEAIPGRFAIAKQNAESSDVSELIMNSPKLDNQFTAKFFKYFMKDQGTN